MSITWGVVCQYCQKRGSSRSGNEREPISRPSMGGRCPVSPNGVHAPEWRRF